MQKHVSIRIPSVDLGIGCRLPKSEMFSDRRDRRVAVVFADIGYYLYNIYKSISRKMWVTSVYYIEIMGTGGVI